MRQVPRRTAAVETVPLLATLFAGVAIAVVSPTASSAQTAPRPSASELTLVSEGDAGEVVLSGRGVEEFRSVALRSLTSKAAPRGIDAALGKADRGERRLGFRVARGATEGRFAVDLIRSDGRVVRLDFTLAVVAARPRLTRLDVAPGEVEGGTAAALYVALDRPAGDDGAVVALSARGSGAARIPSRIGIRPGATEAKIEIATAVVTSPADVRVVATLGDDRLAAGLVVLPAYTARALTTATLTMSGARFVPTLLETSGLRATGLRFVPVVLEVAPLRATGLRFAPHTVVTPTLRMTGRSDPS